MRAVRRALAALLAAALAGSPAAAGPLAVPELSAPRVAGAPFPAAAARAAALAPAPLAAASLAAPALAAPVLAAPSAAAASPAAAPAAAAPVPARAALAAAAQTRPRVDAAAATFDGAAVLRPAEAAEAIPAAANVLADRHVDAPPASRLYSAGLRGLGDAAGTPRPVQARDLLALRAALNPRREGVGMAWAKSPLSAVVVTRVEPGSPAAAAGLRAGDWIQELAGRATIGMSGEDFSRLLAGGARALVRRPRGDAFEAVLAPARYAASGETLWSAAVAVFRAALERAAPRAPGALASAAVSAMTRLLDPHTELLTPVAATAWSDRLESRGRGLGALISDTGAGVRVVDVEPGSPAAEAGLAPGDRWTAIDGRPLTGLALGTVLSLTRTGPGAPVRISFERDGAFYEARLFSRVYRTPLVSSQLMPGGVGYVRLSVFSEGAAEAIFAAAKGLGSQGARSLVLDLRGNRGGRLDEAVAVTSLFVAWGQTVVETRRRDGDKEHGAEDDERLGGVPLAVLVDRDSASASEVVALALKSHGAATVVGEPTYGKGTGQEHFDSPLGDLKVTTLRWFGPDGSTVEKRGLAPNVSVPVDDETRAAVARALHAHRRGVPLDETRDPALTAALHVLGVRP